MDLNALSMSQLPAINLALEWKILRLFLFSYSKANIAGTFSAHLIVLLICF